MHNTWILSDVIMPPTWVDHHLDYSSTLAAPNYSQQQTQVSGVQWIVLMNFTLTLVTIYYHIFFQISTKFNIAYLVSKVHSIV